MTEKELNNGLTSEERKVLDSIRPSRIIVPVVIGVMAILYLSYRQFDPSTFFKISWTGHVFFWLGIAFVMLILRHIALAIRLVRLSNGHFSFWKGVELVFIWEFSSAVSPTALGGSLVAFFMLAQERLSAARTATIVLYTIIVDSLFFMLAIPFIIAVFGGFGIRPGAHSFLDSGAWGWTLLGLTLMMSLYGLFFFYGLFVSPQRLKWLMVKFTSFRWTSKWRERAEAIGDELILASSDMRKRHWTLHLEVTFYTFVAWALRFLILNSLIVAFVPDTGLGPYNQLLLWSRSVSMYMIMAFIPTPGGSGIEVFFSGFFEDFFLINISVVIVFTWRLITYYTYLVGGVIVIPNWIRKVLIRRLKSRKKQS